MESRPLKTSSLVRRAAALLLAGAAAGAFAQVPADPVDEVPPDAKRNVLDLNYRTQDLKPRTVDFQVRETKLEILIELPADVLFDFDKATLRPASAKALANAAELIRTKSKGPVKIAGYTDAKGSAPYNKKLSEHRAQAVRNHLVKIEGLKKVSFNVRGFGADNPVAPNAKPDGSDDPEGRQKNRRVEIVMRKAN
jgi:outer membrane protein OmpA-like peptidoglycan-associated protein